MRVPRWLPQAGAYLLIVALAFSGFRLLERERDSDRAQQIRDTAQACVTSWSVREDIRDAVEEATRRGASGGAISAANGLITFATAAGRSPTPEQVAKYRAIAAQEAEKEAQRGALAARAQIRNPTCDLAAAKRRLR